MIIVYIVSFSPGYHLTVEILSHNYIYCLMRELTDPVGIWLKRKTDESSICLLVLVRICHTKHDILKTNC